MSRRRRRSSLRPVVLLAGLAALAAGGVALRRTGRAPALPEALDRVASSVPDSLSRVASSVPDSLGRAGSSLPGPIGRAASSVPASLNRVAASLPGPLRRSQPGHEDWQCACGTPYRVSGMGRHRVYWPAGAGEQEPVLGTDCVSCGRPLPA